MTCRDGFTALVCSFDGAFVLSLALSKDVTGATVTVRSDMACFVWGLPKEDRHTRKKLKCVRCASWKRAALSRPVDWNCNCGHRRQLLTFPVIKFDWAVAPSTPHTSTAYLSHWVFGGHALQTRQVHRAGLFASLAFWAVFIFR